MEAEELIMFEIRRRRDARVGWVGDAYRGTAAVAACRGRGLQGSVWRAWGRSSIVWPCHARKLRLPFRGHWRSTGQL